MKTVVRVLTFATLVAAAGLAQAAGGRCDGTGPCGPPGMEWAVPQGFHGADYRPACARHDRCYSTPGASRYACDKRFQQDLHCACRNSRYPVLCRMQANMYYAATRLFGGPAFAASQRDVWPYGSRPVYNPRFVFRR